MFYHLITEFDFSSSRREEIFHFQARVIARRRKAWFHLRMSRGLIFAAQQGWMTFLLPMSRPLFVGSYLQVTWWVSANEKEEKFATNDNMFYSDV